MEWYNWFTLLGGSAVLGAIAVDIYVKIKYTGKKSWEKKKKEREEDLVRLVKDVIKEELDPVKTELKAVKDEISLIKSEDIAVLKDCNRDCLRDQLLTSFRYCESKGFRTMQDTENWSYMYESYIKLNGNSFIHNLKEEFSDIPLVTDDRNLKNKF